MGRSSANNSLLRLKQDIAITIANHVITSTAPNGCSLSLDDHCLWWQAYELRAPNVEWLFRRDSNVLESPECLVHWKESVLHYAWWLLFSSHGAVRRHCRSCPVSTNCTVFTDCCFGVYFSPLPLLPAPFFFLPSLLYFTLLWKWSQRALWTPLTGPGSRVVVDPGFRGALSWAGYCDKASPRCQATQENEREKVALLLSPCIISHSKWQPSTQAQMPTDAGVSARGVRVDVWMCVCTQHPECECRCAWASGFTILWNLAAYRTLCCQIT